MTHKLPSVDCRYTIVWVKEVRYGNPNGDPDSPTRGPRRDEVDQTIWATGTSQKRMLRDCADILIRDANGDVVPPGFELLIKHEAVRQEAYKAIHAKIDPTLKDAARVQVAVQQLRDAYWDVRVFGATAIDDTYSCGRLAGAAFVYDMLSVDPVQEVAVTITCCSPSKMVAKGKDRDDLSETGRLGGRALVPYALMRSHCVVLPANGRATQMTSADLDLLFQSLRYCYRLVRSVNKGEMCNRRLVIFKHSDRKGDCQDEVLYDLVKVHRITDPSIEARSFADYRIEVDTANLPKGVSIYLDE